MESERIHSNRIQAFLVNELNSLEHRVGRPRVTQSAEEQSLIAVAGAPTGVIPGVMVEVVPVTYSGTNPKITE